METDEQARAQDIGRTERWKLRLVFGGPVSWWVPLARLVGVKVSGEAAVDDESLAHAEAGALLAGQRFGAGLAATTVFVVALLAVLPAQGRLIESLSEGVFHAICARVELNGGSWALADALASLAVIAVGLSVGMLNAAVFGGVPLVLLRRCAQAAAPAVAVAMTQGDDAIDGPQAETYPRVALAAEHMLYPRGRARGR